MPSHKYEYYCASMQLLGEDYDLSKRDVFRLIGGVTVKKYKAVIEDDSFKWKLIGESYI